jgi:hypothetical protein
MIISLIIIFLIRQKKTSGHTRLCIRTGKVISTSYCMFLYVRIIYVLIRSDTSHSVYCCKFLSFLILHDFCWPLAVIIGWNLWKKEHIRSCRILWQDRIKILVCVRSYKILYDLTSGFWTWDIYYKWTCPVQNYRDDKTWQMHQRECIVKLLLSKPINHKIRCAKEISSLFSFIIYFVRV